MTHSNRNSGVCDTCHQTSCCCAPTGDCLNQTVALQVYQSQLDQVSSELFNKIDLREALQHEVSELSEHISDAKEEAIQKKTAIAHTQEMLARLVKHWAERMECCQRLLNKLSIADKEMSVQYAKLKEHLAHATAMLDETNAKIVGLEAAWQFYVDNDPDLDGDSNPLTGGTGAAAELKAAVEAAMELVVVADADLNAAIDDETSQQFTATDAKTAWLEARIQLKVCQAKAEVYTAWIEYLQGSDVLESPDDLQALLYQWFNYDIKDDPYDWDDLDSDKVTTGPKDAIVDELHDIFEAAGHGPCDKDHIRMVLKEFHNNWPVLTSGNSMMASAQEWSQEIVDYINDILTPKADGSCGAESDAVTLAEEEWKDAEAKLEDIVATRETRETVLNDALATLADAIANLPEEDCAGNEGAWQAYLKLQIALGNAKRYDERIKILSDLVDGLRAALASMDKIEDECCREKCDCECDDKPYTIPARWSMTFSNNREARTSCDNLKTVLSSDFSFEGTILEGGESLGTLTNPLAGQVHTQVIGNMLVVGIDSRADLSSIASDATPVDLVPMLHEKISEFHRMDGKTFEDIAGPYEADLRQTLATELSFPGGSEEEANAFLKEKGYKVVQEARLVSRNPDGEFHGLSGVEIVSIDLPAFRQDDTTSKEAFYDLSYYGDPQQASRFTVLHRMPADSITGWSAAISNRVGLGGANMPANSRDESCYHPLGNITVQLPQESGLPKLMHEQVSALKETGGASPESDHGIPKTSAMGVKIEKAIAAHKFWGLIVGPDSVGNETFVLRHYDVKGGGAHIPHFHVGYQWDHDEPWCAKPLYVEKAFAGNLANLPKTVYPNPYGKWLCEKAEIENSIENLEIELMHIEVKLNLLLKRRADLKARICDGHDDWCGDRRIRGIQEEINVLQQQRLALTNVIRDIAMSLLHCGNPEYDRPAVGWPNNTSGYPKHSMMMDKYALDLGKANHAAAIEVEVEEATREAAAVAAKQAAEIKELNAQLESFGASKAALQIRLQIVGRAVDQLELLTKSLASLEEKYAEGEVVQATYEARKASLQKLIQEGNDRKAEAQAHKDELAKDLAAEAEEDSATNEKAMVDALADSRKLSEFEVAVKEALAALDV